MAESVVIVDDEKEITDLLGIYLTNEGYEVHKFYVGKPALAYMESSDVSCAILDVMLPDLNGFDLCQKLRQSRYFPIIMLTAKVQDSDKIEGLSLGADDYITKPFNPLEVVARVRTQLRRYTLYNKGSQQEDAGLLTIRGLTLRKETGEATLNGQPLVLTRLEFEILYYLADHRGQVVTTEELYESVWKEKYLNQANTIMVHIGRIRSAMGESTRHPKYIKTVWGLGYTIE